MALLQHEGVPLHLLNTFADGRVDRVERTARPRQPHAEIGLDRRVEITAPESLLFLCAERLDLVRPRVAREARSDEDESRHSLGRLDRELQGG